MKTHLLLDIEGTTCPFNFIVDVLFPYAQQNLEPFLNSPRINKNNINLLDSLIFVEKSFKVMVSY